jgi:hypothetical protein
MAAVIQLLLKRPKVQEPTVSTAVLQPTIDTITLPLARRYVFVKSISVQQPDPTGGRLAAYGPKPLVTSPPKLLVNLLLKQALKGL